MFFYKIGLISLLSALLAGCASSQLPIRLADSVDLDKFMGDWYVIANIPTFIEKGAHNAVETYEMNADGTIATTFTFNKDGFDGEQKQYTPKGFVSDESNAVWGMQFIWPIKADYRIIYLNADYSQTIIGRQKRDFVWIMARTSIISDLDYQALLSLLEQEGYNLSEIQKVPQQWD